MKYSTIVSELSDWINKLDNQPELQELLVKARKQIIETDKVIASNELSDNEKKFKEHVANEVQKLAAKLKAKA